MSHYLIQQIAEAPNIFVRTGTVVEAAHGENQLEQLTLKDMTTGRAGRRRGSARRSSPRAR
jgi:thioredoxin reductase (NADPH)